MSPFLHEEPSSDGLQRSKPAPDILQVALERAGCSAADAVLLGDAPDDVLAARKAGVAVIALRSGGHPNTALREPLAIYDDAADLLANFESPIFVERASVSRARSRGPKAGV